MDRAGRLLARIWQALDGRPDVLDRLVVTGEGALPSAFAVTDFAAASTAAAALALADLVEAQTGEAPAVAVDRRLASLWFSKSIRPIGWSLPPQWDPVAGDYRAKDGWIRLHTNAPHHRAAALSVLRTANARDAVAAEVATWSAQELEDAVVAAGGCAAKMRTLAEWAAHPQGRAVAAENLVHRVSTPGRSLSFGALRRPLAGLRVLDLTRVLAGPVGTRFLAGFGADVLRIDPPDWDEPAVLPEVTLGKRRARLDLRAPDDRAVFERLLSEADVFIHGYRSDALERLGFGVARRAELAPGQIDVALDAYGWTGLWAHRRGFDSLVQMSAGLAARGMEARGADAPTPLPVQALDYGTGYLVAAAALRALADNRRTGDAGRSRLSLARTAAFLAEFPSDAGEAAMAPESDADLAPAMEQTHWGPAQRLQPPVTIAHCPMQWDRPAGLLGDGAPAFETR